MQEKIHGITCLIVVDVTPIFIFFLYWGRVFQNFIDFPPMQAPLPRHPLKG
jgi:hypothetical protein